MIKVEHGKATINGTGIEILAETTILLEAVHHSIEEHGGEVFALACMATVLENYKNSIDGLDERCIECEDEEDADPEVVETLDEAPTIVEADKAESENKE